MKIKLSNAICKTFKKLNKTFKLTIESQIKLIPPRMWNKSF